MEFIVMDATETTQQTESTEAQEKAGAEQQTSQQQEQTAEMSEEAKLAAEALAATEEPAGDTPEIEGMKKESERLLGEITARRALNRELDRKIAEKTAAEQAALPPEKSPAEIFLEEHENDVEFNPDTDPLPANVQLAQNKWEKEQAEKNRQKLEQATASSTANKAYLKAREKYSDFDEIVLGAEDLLTEGDQIDVKNAIKNGDDPAEFLYKRCIFKTLEAGGERARTLRAKLQAKVKSTKASVQPKQEKSDGSKEGEKKDEKKVPETPPSDAKEVINNPRMAQIYATFLD